MRRQFIIAAISGAIVILGAAFSVYAFTGPTCSPPNCNVLGPVWLQENPTVQQNGSFYITGGSYSKLESAFNVGASSVEGSGNVALSNDLYFTGSNKSVRIDKNGTNALRIGNYDSGSEETFTLSVVAGNPYTEVIRFEATDGVGIVPGSGRICLNGSCITSWPSSSSTGDLTDILAGTGITVTNGSGPQPTVTADFTTVQARVGGASGQCDAGSSIRIINANGTVTCEPDDVGGASSGLKKFRYGSTGGLSTPAGTQPINVPLGGDAVNDGNWSRGPLVSSPITYIGSGTIVVRARARMGCPGDGYPPMVKNGQIPSMLGTQYFSLQNGDTLWPYKTAAAAQTCSNIAIFIQEVEGIPVPSPAPTEPTVEEYGTKKFQYTSSENVSTLAGTRAVNIAVGGDIVNDGNWSKGATATGPITYTGSGTVVVKASAYMTCGGINGYQPMFKNGVAPSILGTQYFSLQNGDTLWPYKTAAAAQTCGNVTIVIQEVRTLLSP